MIAFLFRLFVRAIGYHLFLSELLIFERKLPLIGPKFTLEEPVRRASGYRQYSQEAVTQIRFIKRSQQLGFSLKEILELLTLRVDGQNSCGQVKERAAVKLAEVEQKMVELQQMRQALLQVASLCAGEGPRSRCPMLDALEHD